MSAPVGHTCPKIDNVIDNIKDAIKEAESIQSTLSDLIGRNDLMEKIRDANATLREWGEGLESELEEMTSERDSLQEELEAAQAEIAALRAEAVQIN